MTFNQLVIQMAALRSERDALRKALELSATRLDICVGRMRGCNDKPQKHELLDEVVGWVIEAREALSAQTNSEEIKW